MSITEFPISTRSPSVASVSAIGTRTGGTGDTAHVTGSGAFEWYDAYSSTPESAAGASQAVAVAAGLVKAASGGGFWRRVVGPDQAVTPQMAGAAADWDGTTGTDDATAFSNCFEMLKHGYKVVVPAGSYYLGSQVTLPLRDECRVDWVGTLYTDYGVVLGDGTLAVGVQVTGGIKVRVAAGTFGTNSAINWTGSTQFGVDLVNLVGCSIYIADIIGFQTNIRCHGDDNAFTGNQIFLGRIRNGQTSLLLEATDPLDDGAGFVNENTFYGGNMIFGSDVDTGDKATCCHLKMIEGSTRINNNIFFRPSFEAAVGFDWKAFEMHGVQNAILWPRMEKANTGEFVALSQFNQFYSSFQIIPENITDNGQFNQKIFHETVRWEGQEADSTVIGVTNRESLTDRAVAALSSGGLIGCGISADALVTGYGTNVSYVMNTFSDPESSVNAPRGSIALRRQDANTINGLYVKVTGSGNTGWFGVDHSSAGTTANRPANAYNGQRYMDTDLGHPIWWLTGTGWVDHAGVAA